MKLLTKRGLLVALAMGLFMVLASPTPSNAATAYTTAPVNMRTGTNTSTGIIQSIPGGVALNVQCQQRGQAISGTYNSDWWAKATYNGHTGYVSRAYVRVPTGSNVPVCSTSTPPPTPTPTPIPGGNIARSEIIARGMDWVRRGVPYSMSRSTTDRYGRHYRTDCSGFVSMALHLTGSPSTVNLTSYGVYRINKADLRPGDLVGNLGPGTGGAAGHVVIFNGWVAGSNQTRFHSIEQTPPRAVAQVRTWGNSFWNKAAWRYNKAIG